MTSRMRLPQRRGAETFEFEVGGLRYTCTIGRFPDGTIAEIFLTNGKAGSDADAAARDSGILTSLLLQHGCDIATIAHAISRNRDGTAASVVGAALDIISKESAP
jgi:ribonucleoside-diphosphate reductase alpha chain